MSDETGRVVQCGTGQFDPTGCRTHHQQHRVEDGGEHCVWVERRGSRRSDGVERFLLTDTAL